MDNPKIEVSAVWIFLHLPLAVCQFFKGAPASLSPSGGLANLSGVVQNVHGQQFARRTHQHQLPAPREDYPPQRCFCRLPQRVHQHGVGMLSRRAIGQKVKTAPGEKDRMDLAHGHELFQDQRLVPSRTELVQFLGFDHDMLVGGIFVAAFDRFGRYRAVARTVLLVADPLTAAGMQKVEVGSRSSAAYRRIGFDRNSDQADA